MRSVLMAVIGVLLLTLSGCSSETDNPPVSRILLSTLKEAATQGDVAATRVAVLAVTRAQVEAAGQPLLRVQMLDTGAWSTLALAARNGPVETFLAGDDVSLSLRDGILTGSRGLGQDLMGLAISNIVDDSGVLRRSYRHLDTRNRIVSTQVACSLSTGPPARLTILEQTHRVRKVTEQCRGDGVEFTNLYWKDPGTGMIWKSRQWLSPALGQLEIEVLKSGGK
jgi:group 4 capsule polysaccharide lipoprotein GfcB/YjbF